jgi:hypothetical protein
VAMTRILQPTPHPAVATRVFIEGQPAPVRANDS